MTVAARVTLGTTVKALSMLVLMFIASSVFQVSTSYLPAARAATLINIRSQANGLLVSAELGWSGNSYGILRARSNTLGPWEVFTLIPFSDGTVALKANNNLYVSAEFGWSGNAYGTLRARATNIGEWEHFYRVRLGDGSYAFEALGELVVHQICGLDCHYVSAELGWTGNSYGILRARSYARGPWERFWFTGG